MVAGLPEHVAHNVEAADVAAEDDRNVESDLACLPSREHIAEISRVVADPHASSAQTPRTLFPSHRFMSFPALWEVYAADA